MSTARFIVGDSLTVLRSMPDASVDLVLTSPPFLALRSYLPADHPDKALEMGSEPTPGAFIDALLTLTEECRRVLAPHGTLCVELGDTYSGSGGAGGDYGEGGLRDGQQRFDGSASRAYGTGAAARPARVGRDSAKHAANPSSRSERPGWPLDKSLCLIPELYRIALVYGFNPLTGRETPRWRARNVVRWVRPNPPVGALGDKFRPATSEMVVACVGRKRYFDLDAVRTAHKVNPTTYTGNGYSKGRPEGIPGEEHMPGNPAGAPPLDWWAIPTEPYFTPDGLVVPAEGTFHQVRVPLDAGGDGIQRTTSPSCQVHGLPDHLDSSALGGERAGTEPSHSARIGDRPALGLDADSSPTSSNSDRLALGEDPAVPVATPRSTPVHRTGLAPSTTPAGTPSAQRSDHTADRPSEPGSSAPHPDTSQSSSAAACRPADERGTSPHTAGTPESSSACTCSYYVTVSVASESTSDYATWPADYWPIPTEGFPGSHYATWPSDLLVRPIKAMCPLRVCRTCGVPSERIVSIEHVANRSTNGPQSLDRRHSDGGSPGFVVRADREVETTGWTDCGHNDYRPGIVLDPFAGSGTTLAVATGHGRDAIGVDLDERNADLARQRVGMFLTVEHHAPSAVQRSDPG